MARSLPSEGAEAPPRRPRVARTCPGPPGRSASQPPPVCRARGTLHVAVAASPRVHPPGGKRTGNTAENDTDPGFRPREGHVRAVTTSPRAVSTGRRLSGKVAAASALAAGAARGPSAPSYWATPPFSR